MAKRNPVEKKIQRKCYVVGLIAFVSALFLAYFLLENIKKNEQAAVTYTAQDTVRRIQSQLDEYVTCSNVLENVILAGYELNEEGFSTLASMLPNEDGEGLRAGTEGGRHGDLSDGGKRRSDRARSADGP